MLPLLEKRMRSNTIIQCTVVILAMALCAAAASAAGPPFSCTNITAAPAATITGTILRMSAGTNAHGALPTDASYINRIVCTMDPVLLTSSFNCVSRAACLANETSVLRLSSPTNAHASGPGIGGYTQQVCCNIVTIGSSNVIKQTCDLISPAVPGVNAVCPENMRQIVRLSSPSNAHLSNNSYPYVVCCDLPSECNDGIDNDGDGYVDWNGAAGIRPDPGCLGNPYHMTERCSSAETGCPACDNGEDDDADSTTDYPNDRGCTSPADEDEFDITIETPYCEPDCSYQIDRVCHKECVGKPEATTPYCEVVLDECNGRPVGSMITQPDGSMKACCGGVTVPPLQSSMMLYNTQKDRVRSTRIVKTASGESLVMAVVSFK